MTGKQRERIESEYAGAHSAALVLIEEIAEKLADMPAPDDGEQPINWGHVGSLRHVCDQLQQIYDFLD